MSIFDTEVTLIDGTTKTLATLAKGPILVVNVASRCGLTPQYEALEALQKKYGAKGFKIPRCVLFIGQNRAKFGQYRTFFEVFSLSAVSLTFS